MGSKVYMQPLNFVFATVHDIKELQKGKGTFNDVPNGKMNFVVNMYLREWEYQFTLKDIGKNRCEVNIEIGGDIPDKEKQTLRMFALLDSMLVVNTKIELSEQKRAEQQNYAK